MVAAYTLVLAAGAALPCPHPPIAAFYDSQTLQAGHHAKQTATLGPRVGNVLVQAQIGDSLVQNVCCRHRPGSGAEDDFPDHGTKTAFELPIRSGFEAGQRGVSCMQIGPWIQVGMTGR